MENSEDSSRTRHKAKFIKKKSRDRKIAAEKLRKANQGRTVGEPEVETSDDNPPVIVGNRIVDLTLLANELECPKCKNPLSLKNMEKEIKRGLGSHLNIRCVHCLFLKPVPTSQCVDDEEGSNRKFFEINYQMAMACLHVGIGNQGLNKLLACARIPTLNWNTHKDYERRVGPVVEATAKESCDRAAKIGRELTIKNVEEIEKMV
ncbi:uncharacterized protein LOC114841283 [Diachasma alloeum]|uniref:uncharacterized protein LOC114841283 n=1 Tax=Diachasma alloeum TaxID=454923 RepID=UPI0010FB482C|nr:uncharacterized protein LOC114841283 [Diachasma alloeum]